LCFDSLKGPFVEATVFGAVQTLALVRAEDAPQNAVKVADGSQEMDRRPRERMSEGMAPKGNIVQRQVPSQFTHTTLTSYPDKIVGITLLDELPGIIGIYLRDENGGMWSARTVNRFPTEAYQTIARLGRVIAIFSALGAYLEPMWH
jgi:hypothetical protein